MANKLKTHQATAKRFKKVGKKSFLKRAAGQNHFNSRDRGVKTMGKRRDVSVKAVDVPALNQLLPHAR
jgi:ribosomal protein L35